MSGVVPRVWATDEYGLRNFFSLLNKILMSAATWRATHLTVIGVVEHIIPIEDSYTGVLHESLTV